MKRLLSAAAALLLTAGAAQAQGTFSLTNFFSASDFAPLAKTAKVKVLAAQSASGTPQSDVNAFDQFFLINADGTLMVKFGRDLNVQGTGTLPYWAGAVPWDNHKISSDIQSVWLLVKAHFKITGNISNVAVLESSGQGSPLIYDYSVPLSPGSNVCQQYTIAIATMHMQLGMQADCLWILPPSKSAHPAGMQAPAKRK